MKGLRWSFLMSSDLTLVENLAMILSVSYRLFSILSQSVRLTRYCCKLVSVKSLTILDGSILSISCEMVVRPDLRVLRSSSVRQLIGRWSKSSSLQKSCYSYICDWVVIRFWMNEVILNFFNFHLIIDLSIARLYIINQVKKLLVKI